MIDDNNKDEKDVIFFGLVAGWTEMSSLEEGRWTVTKPGKSGSVLLENMALDDKKAKSMYSPLMICSLTLGGTGVETAELA